MFAVAVQVLYDHSKKAEARYNRAAKAGVTVSAETLLNALRQAYQNYYTTGEYRSTLQIRKALRRSSTKKSPDGWYAIVGVPTADVATPSGTVDRGKVALYWELGWSPRGSSTRYHVPLAVPAATQSAADMRDAFARTVKRYMEAP
jgi:hypothetical protein